MTSAQETPRTELAVHECWALLRSVEVGRLAVCMGGLPEIFPVNFVVGSGAIVFRTGEGTKLVAITESPEVAFEADGYDAVTRHAWSVVARGRAADVRTAEAVKALALPLFPWHGAAKHRLIELAPTQITGRRFLVADRERWRTPLMSIRPAAPE